MAAGNRNKEGKATDLVVHIKMKIGGVLCRRLNYGISTDLSPEQGNATCLKCLAKMDNLSFAEKKELGIN